MRNTQHTTNLRRSAMGAALLTAFAAMTGMAMADPPVSMAPPVSNAVSIGTYGPNSSTSADSVFNFTDIPVNQKVPLTRAVFDQGGYQLFDTAGETVVVPFTNENLYVMKFAVSPDDTMYFMNEDGTPVLYVPQNGYLENATVPGAKWYPFSKDFRPATPVFLGVAPSYREYIDTGWYPDTVLYGGYYCNTPYISGAFFQPTFGLTFFIGGNRYNGWHNYHSYVIAHPAPYHISYFNRPIYSVISRPHTVRPFQGSFNRPDHGDVRRPGFGGSNPRFNGGNSNGNHEWHGNGGTSHGNGGQPSNGHTDSHGDYHVPGGTYHFTGNPGATDSDPRRVPHVNLGGDSNRPSGGSFQGTTNSPSQPIMQRNSASSSHFFQGSRPEYQNNRPSFQGSQGTSGSRPSYQGGQNNSRPGFSVGASNSRPSTDNHSSGGRAPSGGNSGGRAPSGGGGGGRAPGGGGGSHGGGGDHHH